MLQQLLYTALYQINPEGIWHCCWEVTDLWASGIPVLECKHLLLFRAMLPCPLSSYMFMLPMVFPQATQKNLILRQNSVRYGIFLRKRTIAHFSPALTYDTSSRILLPSFYGLVRVFWSFVGCGFSFSYLAPFCHLPDSWQKSGFCMFYYF